MKRKSHPRTKRITTKSVLRLPDLEHARAAVLNSLTSPDAQGGYGHAIDEFVDWCCSEPRLAFSRIVVLRYPSHLESRQLAPGTINLRLGAVRRLAYEAADCGLVSADLAAGIRRVNGVKKLGVRLGNWLRCFEPDTAEAAAREGDADLVAFEVEERAAFTADFASVTLPNRGSAFAAHRGNYTCYLRFLFAVILGISESLGIRSLCLLPTNLPFSPLQDSTEHTQAPMEGASHAN